MLRSTRSPVTNSPYALQDKNCRTTFSSLSKNKRNNFFMSQVSRPDSDYQNPAFLHSQRQHHDYNRVTVREQYRLFANAIKQKKYTEQEKLHPQTRTTPSSQYWNFQVHRNNLGKQNVRKRERTNSKHKLDKIFEEAPKRLIRQKRDKERQTCMIQNSIMVQGPKWEPNETDLVNTSEASAQFDMSPHLY